MKLILFVLMLMAGQASAAAKGPALIDVIADQSSSLVRSTYQEVRPDLQYEPEPVWLDPGEWIGKRTKGDFYRVHWTYATTGKTGVEVRGMPWRICPTWGEAIFHVAMTNQDIHRAARTQPGTYDFYGHRITRLGDHKIEDRVFLGRKIVTQPCFFGWVYNGWEFDRCTYEYQP